MENDGSTVWQSIETENIWRERRCRLKFYTYDDRLVLTIELTDDQAVILGQECAGQRFRDEADERNGIEEYPLDFVNMEVVNIANQTAGAEINRRS